MMKLWGTGMHVDFRQRKLDRIQYIQNLLGELRTMAEAERCDMLTYMIEMAYMEAGDIVRGQRPTRLDLGEHRNAVA